MNHYYNEFDPHAAQWLRNLMDADLIPRGDVDERSITDVSATDLRRYLQCHFFAGIGGWAEALRIAGWPADRPVWTGSCPCQSFSAAGKRKGFDDERDLWPVFAKLIAECRPSVVFGEQVASAIRFGWIDRVRADLEREGYAVGFAVLGAHGVGSPHIRQRLYWVADAKHRRQAKQEQWAKSGSRCRGDCGLGNAIGSDVRRGCGTTPRKRQEAEGNGVEDGACGLDARHAGAVGGMGNTSCDGLEERISDRGVQPGAGRPSTRETAELSSHWDDYQLIGFRDGKTRRIESGIEPLVDGVPFRLADGRTREGVSRAKILKGIGNAIVPQVAAIFIRAFLESEK